MNAEQQLVQALKASQALVSLIESRLRPSRLRQGEPLPALVYQRVGDAPVQSLDGDTSNLDQARLRVTAHAASYEQAKALARAVRDALRGGEITFAGDQDLYDDITQSHSVALDFYLWERPQASP